MATLTQAGLSVRVEHRDQRNRPRLAGRAEHGDHGGWSRCGAGFSVPAADRHPGWHRINDLNQNFTLQYKINAGSWVSVTTGTAAVRPIASVLTNNGDTTQRLTG